MGRPIFPQNGGSALKAPTLSVDFVSAPTAPNSDAMVLTFLPRRCGRIAERTMETWNTALFLALNAPASANVVTIAFAKVAAEYLVYVAAVLAVCLWIRGVRDQRDALISIGTGLLTAFVLSWTIGLLWYHPRPFAIGLGHTLLAHSPDSSFPSDHTTFLWTFGFGLLVTRVQRGWGWVLVLAGLATALARIYVGVHFPLDMVGSAVVAATGAAVAWAVHLHVADRILPLIERSYEFLLHALRLPKGIFPRRVADR